MARFVQAGKLDRRIAVYKPTSTLDAYNEAIGSPTGRPAGSRYDNYYDDEEN